MHDAAMLAEPLAWARTDVEPVGASEVVRSRARIGRFAHVFGWTALRGRLSTEELPRYGVLLAVVLRRALAVA